MKNFNLITFLFVALAFVLVQPAQAGVVRRVCWEFTFWAALAKFCPVQRCSSVIPRTRDSLIAPCPGQNLAVFAPKSNPQQTLGYAQVQDYAPFFDPLGLNVARTVAAADTAGSFFFPSERLTC
jgi:hypothetical protein